MSVSTRPHVARSRATQLTLLIVIDAALGATVAALGLALLNATGSLLLCAAAMLLLGIPAMSLLSPSYPLRPFIGEPFLLPWQTAGLTLLLLVVPSTPAWAGLLFPSWRPLDGLVGLFPNQTVALIALVVLVVWYADLIAFPVVRALHARTVSR